MGVFIGLVLLLFGGGYFARQTSQLRGSAWAGPRTAAQKERGPAKPRSMRQEMRLIKARAENTDWLELRRHERKTGTGHAAVAAPATPLTGTVHSPLQRARVAAQARFPRPGASNGITQTAPAAPARAAGAPTSSSPSPNGSPAPSGSPGRSASVSVLGGAVEKFVDGVQAIHATAKSGGLRAKHRAVKACHEGSSRFSAMAEMLSRGMGEPGQHYGHEITEPIAKGSMHLQAAAIAFAEADAAIASLRGMTVDELATSSRQAPHHDEMAEDGNN